MQGGKAEQLGRILSTVPLALRKEGVSAEELALQFGVDIKTIENDLRLLKYIGTSVYEIDDSELNQEDGRFYMESFAFYPTGKLPRMPMNTTRRESVLLLVVARALVQAGVFPRGVGSYTKLARQLRRFEPKDIEEIEDLSRRIVIEMDFGLIGTKSVIEEGIETGMSLLITYYSYSSHEITDRQVEPLALLISRGFWYLLAWDHRDRDYRYFKVDRIGSVSLTDTPVTHKYKKEHLYPGIIGEKGDEGISVKVSFSGKERWRLVEEWQDAKFTERKKDGWLTMEIRTANLGWLAKYLLRFGKNLRVEKPKELKRLLKQVASEVLDLYG